MTKTLLLLAGFGFTFNTNVTYAASPTFLPYITSSSPDALNPADPASRATLANHMGRVAAYLQAVSPDTVPTRTQAFLKKRLNDWLINSRSNYFAPGVDPLFASSVRSLPRVWISASGSYTTTSQVLSCESQIEDIGHGVVLRFADPLTGERKYFKSMREGCDKKLGLEGRAFALLPIGTRNTVVLKACSKDGVTFTSVDCRGGVARANLGAISKTDALGLVPLWSAKQIATGSRFLTTNRPEISSTLAFEPWTLEGFVIPTALAPMAVIPRGHFMVRDQPTIYYSDGSGLYCSHASERDFVDLGGRSDGANVQMIARIPIEMKPMGACIVPKVPVGPFLSTAGPGKDIYYAYNCGHDCARAEITKFYYSNGANLYCSYDALSDYWSNNRRPPKDIPASRRLATIDSNMIYIGVCRHQ